MGVSEAVTADEEDRLCPGEDQRLTLTGTWLWIQGDRRVGRRVQGVGTEIGGQRRERGRGQQHLLEISVLCRAQLHDSPI